jgi:hypothetical protein
MAETKKAKTPSPFRLLLGSRKFVAGIVYSVIALVCAGASRFGLDWSAEAASATMVPWVLLGISNIWGIAYEDGNQKAAGAGTTTTHEISKAGGTVAEITTIRPDPTGKP